MADRRSATVLMPGTCGELVQGALDGVTFLVTCPIDMYAAVTVTIEPGKRGVVRAPRDAPKAAAAVSAVLRFFGRDDLGAHLRIVSSLPRGKGMGSSTADVAGAIFATSLALGEPIDPRTVADLALRIEPSDGSMFPNVALFDHRQGRRHEDLGPPPPIEVAVLDFGGHVDTIAFNRQDWSALLRTNEPAITEALRLVRRGIREARPDLVGHGTTISAEANQRILFKPELAAVQELAREVDALGINVGHSGTVIGILLHPRRGSPVDLIAKARQRFPTLHAAYACRLIGGGYRRAGEPVAELHPSREPLPQTPSRMA